MTFDMTQCKTGDKLVCRDGTVVKYSFFRRSAYIYRHEVEYDSGTIGSRTDTGFCYLNTESFRDIIGFYKEEKDMNTFDIKDLKTGQRVTTSDGHKYIAITNISHTLYTSTVSLHYKIGAHSYWGTGEIFEKEIVKVEDPDNIQKVLCTYWGEGELSTIIWTTVWEAPAKETPEQIKQRELMEKYEAVKKEFEELGKQIGVSQ